ncbi:MAG: ATP-dependent DNA ligase [Candidatus ainarchaeum sp.]|nr:ATP-dependent DNA ligase [Candidatus ainarchaeum sp.]
MEFSLVSKYFQRLEKTSSRLEMRDILSELFSICSLDQISKLIYFCQGKIGPKYKGKEINIGQSTLIVILSRYLGHTVSTISNKFKELGDLGLVVESLSSGKKQETLFFKEQSFLQVYSSFERMTEIDGKGAIDTKIKIFESILYNADNLSAKYIIRFPISLRLGFSDSTIIDALSLLEENEEKQKEARDLILEKYNLVSDLGLIAQKFKENKTQGIKELSVQPLIPLKPALCERSKDLNEIFERLGKDGDFLIDSKIDGFRMQVHKLDDTVKIYSRNEEDITSMFPDITLNILKIKHNFIIDCEAIGYDPINKKYHDFQVTMQRKRKYDISEKSKELPLHLKVFDIIYFDEKKIHLLPFRERRELLEKYFNIPPVISPTKILITNNLLNLEDFFLEMKDSGFEGLIAKDLNSPYSAGSRGFNWIKYKKSYDKENLDTIDAVIIGGFFGQGKRTVTGLGAILVALYDEKKNLYYSLAKVGSGLKDEILVELSEKLKKITIPKKQDNVVSNIEPDFYVLPKIVVEVNYDDITVSSVHTVPLINRNETLALRFPRFVKYRTDRTEKDTTSLEEIARLFSLQEKSFS